MGSEERIEIPALDFNFAEGWPEETAEAVRWLFSVDPEQVRGQHRLGDLSFDEAPNQMERIRKVIRRLAMQPWVELGDIRGDVIAEVDATRTTLSNMLELSSGQEGAAGTKGQLESELRNRLEFFEGRAAPRAVRALVQDALSNLASTPDDARIRELTETLEGLSTQAAELGAEMDSRKDLVAQFRSAAIESAGGELEAVFRRRATDRGKVARNWLWAVGIAGALALAGAVGTFFALRPDRDPGEPTDFAALGLGVFIFGLLAYGVRVCAQNYRVNRHLEATAESKANALATFGRIVNSVEDEDVKASVTMALAQAIFAAEETGLVDGSGDHVTLVERAAVPLLNRQTPS